MKSYLDLVNEVLTEGEIRENRTGVNTRAITGAMIKHNMNDGFPLLTTKRMGPKNIFAELEFFIKGLTDKRWLQARKCRLWDAWSSPGADDWDLGPIYGAQWRKFNSDIFGDQMKHIVRTLKANPLDRRMIVSAWNPLQLDSMALPPCHVLHKLSSNGEYLDLSYYQRSCDLFLGVPYNIASYAMLLLLYAKESGLKPRYLVAHMDDVHIYENHIEQCKTQLSRTPYSLPTVSIREDNWQGIFNWEYTDFVLTNYQHHEKLTGAIAV